ncbi:uncharacterized protein LOC128390520 isoform X2 [Panonychus citri]|uniref:uncharacterized protein LOC128390520 isoform X2 n=1 Tax=Panonychus citri TaxID=50023 RepID=UPI0023074CC4|nr:uncharacterized protein LOC128390520 isoform X2 [Panonychus citri]
MALVELIVICYQILREHFLKNYLYIVRHSHIISHSHLYLGFMSLWWLDDGGNSICKYPGLISKSLILISGHIHGTDERGRMIRRTLARYLLLMQVFTCQAVSIAIFKRFPTLDHIEDAGFITPEEREVYERVPSDHGKWWVPAQWFSTLAIKARKEGRIKHDIFLYQILEELHIQRGYCGMMFAYDWISIPLVYTQTVTIATYTYFLATLMGRQYLDPAKGYQGHEVDLYVPVFTVLEFFFFMGWLKVAEQLINGYGEDDDDFDLHWCLERNTVLSYHIVDNMYSNNPIMTRDKFWDDPKPILPHTKSSLSFRRQPFLGSAMNLNLDPEEVEIVTMPPIDEEEDDEQLYTSTPASPNLIEIDASEGGGGDEGGGRRGGRISGAINGEEVSSRNRFLPDLRPSRLINMRIGQSCDNISKGPSNRPGIHGEKGGFLSLFPPFLLETPPQKRNRTISLAESMNRNCINMHDMVGGVDGRTSRGGVSAGGGGGGTDTPVNLHQSSRAGLPIVHSDIGVRGGVHSSTGLSIPGSHDLSHGPPSANLIYRPSPAISRKDSGSIDIRSMKDEDLNDLSTSASSSRYRLSSIEAKESSRFNQSFGPKTQTVNPYFPGHLSLPIQPDSPVDQITVNKLTSESPLPPTSITPINRSNIDMDSPSSELSRRSSKVHSVTEEMEEENAEDDEDEDNTLKVEIINNEFTPTNNISENNNNINNSGNRVSINIGSSSSSSSSSSSQDGYSPFASNENTVTSITQLIAAEKKLESKGKEIN